MKTPIIIILSVLLTSGLVAQNVKEYFILENSYKKSLFKTSDGINIEYEYSIVGDSIIVKSTAIKEGLIYHIVENIYRVENNSIILTGRRKKSFEDIVEDTTYTKNKVVLKLPVIKQSNEWDFSDGDGDSFTCEAKFVEVEFEQNTYKAILVRRTNIETKEVDIHYYVDNIGLFKIDYKDENNEFYTYFALLELIK